TRASQPARVVEHAGRGRRAARALHRQPAPLPRRRAARRSGRPRGGLLTGRSPMSETPETDRVLGDIASRLLFENDRVRIWELDLASGERSATHRHDLDYVIVQ